jgi:isoquinoline 1-oxidoreductase beta subunit
VNPAIVEAQMMGGAIMGLSAAMKERIEFAKGGVKSENFADYELIRMSQAPEVEVHIVKSGEKLGGIGEPGVPPIAPAVANAVFTATGARIRQLPMKPDAVLAAMKKA